MKFLGLLALSVVVAARALPGTGDGDDDDDCRVPTFLPAVALR